MQSQNPSEHERDDTVASAVGQLRFTVTRGQEVVEVVGRTNAISEAKRISREQRGQVEVERVDGRVSMQFRDGDLVQYLYETREPRRRSSSGSADKSESSSKFGGLGEEEE